MGSPPGLMYDELDESRATAGPPPARQLLLVNCTLSRPRCRRSALRARQSALRAGPAGLGGSSRAPAAALSRRCWPPTVGVQASDGRVRDGGAVRHRTAPARRPARGVPHSHAGRVRLDPDRAGHHRGRARPDGVVVVRSRSRLHGRQHGHLDVSRRPGRPRSLDRSRGRRCARRGHWAARHRSRPAHGAQRRPDGRGHHPAVRVLLERPGLLDLDPGADHRSGPATRRRAAGGRQAGDESRCTGWSAATSSS